MNGTTSGRRFELVLRRPRLSLNPGVRPTVVIGGRGQPAQWGTGTWQSPVDDSAGVGAVGAADDAAFTLGVYLFNRMWRYGSAEARVDQSAERVVYTAPRLPFGRGRVEVVRSDRAPSA